MITIQLTLDQLESVIDSLDRTADPNNDEAVQPCPHERGRALLTKKYIIIQLVEQENLEAAEAALAKLGEVARG